MKVSLSNIVPFPTIDHDPFRTQIGSTVDREKVQEI